jgi:hypothetical protein
MRCMRAWVLHRLLRRGCGVLHQGLQRRTLFIARTAWATELWVLCIPVKYRWVYYLCCHFEDGRLADRKSGARRTAISRTGAWVRIPESLDSESTQDGNPGSIDSPWQIPRCPSGPICSFHLISCSRCSIISCENFDSDQRAGALVPICIR